MKKNQFRIYVQSTMEHLLDELHQRTRNYQDTFELFEMDAQEITLMRNDKTKLLASALNVAKNSLPIREIAVRFVSGTFRVKIKTY